MLNICIPTIDRLKLIQKTINSIMKNNYEPKKITIIVDDGREAYNKKLHAIYIGNKSIDIKYNPKRLGWPSSLNRIFKETDDDYYFYASDDLIFQPNTLELAMADMNRVFPDGDGLIGITQNLRQYCKAAFGLMGRKWVNRFPDRQAFYPKYIHFACDSELWRYAVKCKKFYFSKAAVKHNRPMDKTKRLAQTTLTRDRAIWFPRRDRRQFWPEYK